MLSGPLMVYNRLTQWWIQQDLFFEGGGARCATFPVSKLYSRKYLHVIDNFIPFDFILGLTVKIETRLNKRPGENRLIAVLFSTEEYFNDVLSKSEAA